MKNIIEVCDLETLVLPAGVEGSTKLGTAAAVAVMAAIVIFRRMNK